MTTDKFIAGLQILQGYFDKLKGFHIGAEHDVVYVYKTDRPVSPEDVAKLVELDWFQEGVNRPEEDDEFEPKHYDPEESWTAYV